MLKKFLLACLVSLTAALGCAASPLRVVAMQSVLGEVAKEVGGPEISLLCLVPGGVDPHTFNPSPADVRAITDADLVLASGFDLEPYLDKLIANSGTHARVLMASAVVRDVVKSAREEQGHAGHGDHDHGEVDPHWWHSIRSIREVTEAVGKEFKQLRPQSAAGIDARSAAYLARLASLSVWAESEMKALPVERRQLVTSHDAFGYLARDYGFKVHPLYGVNPESEPDARALAALITFIRREKIRAIFVDNTENPKLLATMLRESGAVVGGTLYADGLGAPDSPAPTVEGMFKHNLRTLVQALK